MTLREWEEEKDRELEERLTALFRSVRPPQPSAGFVTLTMKAVRQAPLPEGRHPLRRPWTVPAGWLALTAAAAVVAFGGIGDRQVLAEGLASLVTVVIRGGLRLLQTLHTSSAVFELLATISRALVHAMSTRQAGAGLMLMALVAAASLSILNRLLFSEKESSSWLRH